MSNDPTANGAPDRTDADLLRAHVDGDAAAFGELFSRHRDRLWAVALRTTGNPEDAADGLQDALVAAFRRAGSFRGESAVTTWLHRVVVNACLDRIRAAGVRRTEVLPEDFEEYGGAPTSAPDAVATVDPAVLTVAGERRRQVLDALATLPPEQRAALVLVDMEGYPVAEVAQILECAVGTVKSRCARGRTRLLPLLSDLLDGGSGPGDQPPPRNHPDDGAVQPSSSPRAPPREG